MFDDLAAYFYENLAGSYMAYLNVRNNESYGMSKDVQAGLNAATALYHAREHLSEKKKRSHIAAECPDYDLLGDVVNVSKHRTIGDNNPQITRAEQITETIVSTQYEDEDGWYSDIRKEVIVELNDGTKRRLVDMLTEVMNYWGDEFVRLGILENYRPFPSVPYPGNQFVSRKDAKRGMDAEAMQGVRFQQVIMLQEYNMQLGKAEPIPAKDITDVTFTVWKPACSFGLKVTLESEKKYDFEFDMTDDEALEWTKLRTDDERQDMRKQLIQSRATEINQLVAEATRHENDKFDSNK